MATTPTVAATPIKTNIRRIQRLRSPPCSAHRQQAASAPSLIPATPNYRTVSR
jgi:hypothetical protein